MNYERIIAVTNRHLCSGDFLAQVEKTAALGVGGIILREKDLSVGAYRELAVQVLKVCRAYGVRCILHKYADVAGELGCRRIHLPLPDLQKLYADEQKREVLRAFSCLGASVHSVREAIEAQEAGCTYLTAGHIFQTECKKDFPPRGIDFLRNVCKTVSVPVYGIGGIHPDNMQSVLDAGAAGVCMMSEFMR